MTDAKSFKLKGKFIKGIYQGFGFKKGNKMWQKRKYSGSPILGEKRSEETCFKISMALKGNEKIRQSKLKERNPNWKGGITPMNELERSSRKMKEWRRKIYERDNYTCQICRQKGGKLQADHIKPFSLYPKMRYEPSNGRTLCKECHQKGETYGFKVIYRNS